MIDSMIGEKRVEKSSSKTPQISLYFAYYRETVIAASIAVFTLDRAIYYYGASSSDRESRKLMAPYALQWQMIQDAQVYGSRLYDFLGVADPSDPHDHLR